MADLDLSLEDWFPQGTPHTAMKELSAYLFVVAVPI